PLWVACAVGGGIGVMTCLEEIAIGELVVVIAAADEAGYDAVIVDGCRNAGSQDNREDRHPRPYWPGSGRRGMCGRELEQFRRRDDGIGIVARFERQIE